MSAHCAASKFLLEVLLLVLLLLLLVAEELFDLLAHLLSYSKSLFFCVSIVVLHPL